MSVGSSDSSELCPDFMTIDLSTIYAYEDDSDPYDVYCLGCELANEYHVNTIQIEPYMFDDIPSSDIDIMLVALNVFRELKDAHYREDYSLLSPDEVVTRLNTYALILLHMMDDSTL